MLEMHLRQPGCTSSVCEPITKNTKRIQKFKETGDSRYIYQNELDKVCFQHDMAYKIFRDKAFNIAKNPKCDEYQHALASMVYKFSDKKTCGSGIKNENMWNKELAK